MDDPFRNALVVEVGDFFTQDKIFQQRGAAFTRAQRVLIVSDANALVGGEGKILTAFAMFFEGIKLFAVRIRGFHTARRGRLFAWGGGMRRGPPVLVFGGQGIQTRFCFPVIVNR